MFEAGRRQVRSWSQTCGELKFGLSSSLLYSELARASRSAIGPRPASNRSATTSSRFELSGHVEIARICWKLIVDRFEAKFHYAILVADSFKAGSKLIADRFEPASNLSATSFEPARELDSVMEFGFCLTIKWETNESAITVRYTYSAFTARKGEHIKFSRSNLFTKNSISQRILSRYFCRSNRITGENVAVSQERVIAFTDRTARVGFSIKSRPLALRVPQKTRFTARPINSSARR